MKKLVISMLLATAGIAASADAIASPASAVATQPAVATVHYRSATIDGVKMFYREAGPADGPVVLLLHGFPTSSHMFRNLIPLLADRYHVIAPDYPGFGQSDAPDHRQFTYSFAHYADMVDTLMGADAHWAAFSGNRAFDRFTDNEAHFLAARDSFYMATVSEDGWPYVQHRGGPAGFLKMVDDRTLAFADYRGNRQYISTGNLAANDRACLILLDYPRRARLKIYVHVEKLVPDADPALTELVMDKHYKARAERIFRLRLEAFDWNCPQHITPRFTEREIEQAIRPMHERLAQLEAENKALQDRLAKLGNA